VVSDVLDDPADGFGGDGSLDEAADDATPVTVVLLHPDDSRRALLARKLERSPGIEVIASTGDLEAGVATVIDDLPDVVALFPTDDLLDVVVRLERDAPAAAVLVLDPEAEQLAALAAGARGTLPSGGSEITKAVTGIARDEAVLTPEWAGGLLDRMGDLDQRVRRLALLNETEREVLTRLADGETPFDIAEDHAVSERLVNLHVGYAVGKYHRAIEALRTLAHAEEVRAQKVQEDAGAGDADSGVSTDRGSR
jgi:DNA-binding NarL/FixJ family response regulator